MYGYQAIILLVLIFSLNLFLPLNLTNYYGIFSLLIIASWVYKNVELTFPENYKSRPSTSPWTFAIGTFLLFPIFFPVFLVIKIRIKYRQKKSKVI